MVVRHPYLPCPEPETLIDTPNRLGIIRNPNRLGIIRKPNRYARTQHGGAAPVRAGRAHPLPSLTRSHTHTHTHTLSLPSPSHSLTHTLSLSNPLPSFSHLLTHPLSNPPTPGCSMVVRHPYVPDVPTLFNRMAFVYVPHPTVLNLRTTALQKCAAVPRRARI